MLNNEKLEQILPQITVLVIYVKSLVLSPFPSQISSSQHYYFLPSLVIPGPSALTRLALWEGMTLTDMGESGTSSSANSTITVCSPKRKHNRCQKQQASQLPKNLAFLVFFLTVRSRQKAILDDLVMNIIIRFYYGLVN